jgi:hypothetical protein
MSGLDEQEHRVYDPDERPVNQRDIIAEERRGGGDPDGGGFYRHGSGQDPDDNDDRGAERTREEHDPDSASDESRKARKAREGFYNAHAQENKRTQKKESFLSNLGPKKLAFIGGIAGSVIGLLVLALLLFSLLGSLKVVHFATVLRSAGLARFTLQMQKQYARTIFDAATLTEDSTGHTAKALGDRSMLQKMLHINPQKRLTDLGQEGFLKFEFQSEKNWSILPKKNTFKGVVIDGKPVRLDKLSDDKYGKTYAELGGAEKRAINSQFRNTVRAGLSDRLSLEGLSYRSSVMAGIRQLSGIRMIKWPQKDKEGQGKTDAELRSEEIDADKSYIDGTDEKPKSGIKEIQDEADQYDKDVETAVKAGKDMSNIKPKSVVIAEGAQKASLGALAATGACVIHDLNQSFKDAGPRTEDKALKLASDTQTTRDQIAQGHTNARVIGISSDQWEGGDQSPFYKQATGEGGYSQADALKLADVPNIQGPVGAFKTLISISDGIITSAEGPLVQVPGLGKKVESYTCTAILNQYTQYGIAGAELVTAVASAGLQEGLLQGVKVAFFGSLQAAAGVGVGQVIGSMLDHAVKGYADIGFSGMDTGSTRYSAAAVGTDDMQQYLTRQGTFAKPISPAEASHEQQQAMTKIVTMNKQKPFTQRYLAIDNPNSLLGNVVAAIPTNGSGVSTSAQHGLAFIGSLFSSPQSLLQHLGGIFLPHTMAATGQMTTGAQFGVDEWGTPDDEDALRDTPAYSNAENTTAVEGQGEDAYNALMEKYGPCYTYMRASDKPAKCTAEFLSTNEALHWRFYMQEACPASGLSGEILDGPAQDDLTKNCVETKTSDTSTSSATGPATTAGCVGASSPTDTAVCYQPSNNIPCAAGTKDLGVVDGSNSGEYYDQKTRKIVKVAIRLCAIPGFKCSCSVYMKKYTEGKIDSGGMVAVNSRISGAWLAIFACAKNAKDPLCSGKTLKGDDGITFSSNSAFRTHDYQQSLCPCDGSSVAVPGHSNHQMGLALDLANGGSFISTGSPAWNWMKANASQFGIKPYTFESWHWSPTGN